MAMVVALLSAIGLLMPAAPRELSVYGVRAASQQARAMLDHAAAGSATVRSLMADLARTDLIVVVEVQADPPVYHGRTVLAAATEVGRFVRVSIDLMLPARRRVEVLAHELWHALEIAAAPEVRDAAGMRALFSRIGWRVGQVFETQAAIDVEWRVRADHARGRPGQS
jgi:hypothetical protein